MRSLLLFAALLASDVAMAQSYKWVDANGRTHYTDQPPAGGKPVTTLRSTAPAASAGTPAAAPTPAEQEQAFRKRRMDAEEKTARAARDQEAAADKARQCQSATRQLESLESGERVTRRNDAGERVFLDENEIASDRERTRRFMREHCG